MPSDPAKQGNGDGLQVQRLAVTYGQHRALKGVHLQVTPGEIVVILGANGAGKTSLLKAVAGMIAADDGSQVRLDGHVLTGLPPHRIVEAGLALVPEGRGIFGDLSVHDNLALGAFAHRARADAADNLQRVFSLFGRLAERHKQLARTMSGGEQQMVAIGRALMSAPRILMLDEPSLGLSPLLCTELFRNLQRVRDTGVGILLVEQNARQSLAIAERAYLLENGAIVGQGTADQLARDPAVQAAYLGGAAAHALAPATAPATAPLAAERVWTPAIERPTAAALPRAFSVATRVQASTDPLAGVRIADLVQVASKRMADDVQARREQRTPATVPSIAPGATLQDALVRIEHAAAQARRSTPAKAPPTLPASPPPPPAGGLEIWRRPGVEIYRRQPNGNMKKES
jgi:branched-chain amino acid transport system ATP-binding protein